MGAISTTIIVILFLVIIWIATFTTLGVVLKNPLFEKLGIIGPYIPSIHSKIYPQRSSFSTSSGISSSFQRQPAAFQRSFAQETPRSVTPQQTIVTNNVQTSSDEFGNEV
jgi:hypothetical protein